MNSEKFVKTVETERYVWRNVAIGGGGYVTGIAIHPMEPDLVYIRTDVGGAYRWDPHNRQWIQLLDCFGLEDMNLYGVDGIAADPSNPDVLYLAAGKYAKNELHKYYPVVHNEAGPGDVLKSADRGKTWIRTALNRDFRGNREIRMGGECLAVSPDDGRLVYCGTRFDGLWKSTKAAEPGSWEQVSQVPCGEAGIGIRCVVFGQGIGPDRGHQVIYAGVYGKGIHMSDTRGENWVKLKGGPVIQHRMVVAGDGTLYVASDRGVHKYDGKWSEISPLPGERYFAIAVDRNNPQHILCALRVGGFRRPVWRSLDGGASWIEVTHHVRTHCNVPWWPSDYFSAATCAIAMDPRNGNKVWFTDWYGTWVTPDISENPCHFYTFENGHEEMVGFSMCCPPAGANLFTAVADNDGMRHADLLVYPKGKFGGPRLQETTGIDFCEGYPSHMARVGSWDWGKRGSGGTSSDNGVTWNEFGSWPYAANGKLAMSAVNPQNFVVVPIGDTPKVTLDGGNHWHDSQGAPGCSVPTFWSWNHPLASDRVDGSKFYLYNAGGFYRSTDGGRHWSMVYGLPVESWHFVKSAPCIDGEVWISLNHHGLFRSADSGDSFHKVENVEQAYLVAFGKNPPNALYPAVFVFGCVSGTKGIFRSDDKGDTWICISDAGHRIGNDPNCMEGDRQIFGRVYISTNGRGYFFGEPVASGIPETEKSDHETEKSVLYRK